MFDHLFCLAGLDHFLKPFYSWGQRIASPSHPFLMAFYKQTWTLTSRRNEKAIFLWFFHVLLLHLSSKKRLLMTRSQRLWELLSSPLLFHSPPGFQRKLLLLALLHAALPNGTATWLQGAGSFANVSVASFEGAWPWALEGCSHGESESQTDCGHPILRVGVGIPCAAPSFLFSLPCQQGRILPSPSDNECSCTSF